MQREASPTPSPPVGPPSTKGPSVFGLNRRARAGTGTAASPSSPPSERVGLWRSKANTAQTILDEKVRLLEGLRAAAQLHHTDLRHAVQEEAPHIAGHLQQAKTMIDGCLNALGPERTSSLLITIDRIRETTGRIVAASTSCITARAAELQALEDAFKAQGEVVVCLRNRSEAAEAEYKRMLASMERLEAVMNQARTYVKVVIAERLAWQEEFGANAAKLPTFGGPAGAMSGASTSSHTAMLAASMASGITSRISSFAAPFVDRCRQTMRLLDESKALLPIGSVAPLEAASDAAARFRHRATDQVHEGACLLRYVPPAEEIKLLDAALRTSGSDMALRKELTDRERRLDRAREEVAVQCVAAMSSMHSLREKLAEMREGLVKLKHDNVVHMLGARILNAIVVSSASAGVTFSITSQQSQMLVSHGGGNGFPAMATVLGITPSLPAGLVASQRGTPPDAMSNSGSTQLAVSQSMSLGLSMGVTMEASGAFRGHPLLPSEGSDRAGGGGNGRRNGSMTAPHGPQGSAMTPGGSASNRRGRDSVVGRPTGSRGSTTTVIPSPSHGRGSRVGSGLMTSTGRSVRGASVVAISTASTPSTPSPSLRPSAFVMASPSNQQGGSALAWPTLDHQPAVSVAAPRIAPPTESPPPLQQSGASTGGSHQGPWRSPAQATLEVSSGGPSAEVSPRAGPEGGPLAGGGGGGGGAQRDHRARSVFVVDPLPEGTYATPVAEFTNERSISLTTSSSSPMSSQRPSASDGIVSVVGSASFSLAPQRPSNPFSSSSSLLLVPSPIGAASATLRHQRPRYASVEDPVSSATVAGQGIVGTAASVMIVPPGPPLQQGRDGGTTQRPSMSLSPPTPLRKPSGSPASANMQGMPQGSRFDVAGSQRPSVGPTWDADNPDPDTDNDSDDDRSVTAGRGPRGRHARSITQIPKSIVMVFDGMDAPLFETHLDSYGIARQMRRQSEMEQRLASALERTAKLEVRTEATAAALGSKRSEWVCTASVEALERQHRDFSQKLPVTIAPRIASAGLGTARNRTASVGVASGAPVASTVDGGAAIDSTVAAAAGGEGLSAESVVDAAERQRKRNAMVHAAADRRRLASLLPADRSYQLPQTQQTPMPMVPTSTMRHQSRQSRTPVVKLVKTPQPSDATGSGANAHDMDASPLADWGGGADAASTLL